MLMVNVDITAANSGGLEIQRWPAT